MFCNSLKGLSVHNPNKNQHSSTKNPIVLYYKFFFFFKKKKLNSTPTQQQIHLPAYIHQTYTGSTLLLQIIQDQHCTSSLKGSIWMYKLGHAWRVMLSIIRSNCMDKAWGLSHGRNGVLYQRRPCSLRFASTFSTATLLSYTLLSFNSSAQS